MPKLKCVIRYDGTNFAGFQYQPEGRTVQGEIESTLQRIHKGDWIRIHSSGRTDKGVHAIGQVMHFESELAMAPQNWERALNTLLPGDIQILEVMQVADEFHSRYAAVEKEYRYYVDLGAYDVFKRNYTYFYKYKVNFEWIERACRYFEGTHDFTTFSSAKATTKGSKVRTLTEVSAKLTDETIVFTFRGNGFLYNMVRIIVGVLLDIGQGRIAVDDVPKLLEAKNRESVGMTAPAQGLYLWKVTYE